MILSNVQILDAIQKERVVIDPLTGKDPGDKPFNTTSIDLRLSNQISVPKTAPAAFDLRNEGLAAFLAANSDHHEITVQQPFCLPPKQFILGRTEEKIGLPIIKDGVSYAARVEGRSSLARCGLLVILPLRRYTLDSREL